MHPGISPKIKTASNTLLKGSCDLPSNTVDSCSKDEHGASQAKDTSKNLDSKPPSWFLEDRAVDGVGRESTDRGDEENNAAAESNFRKRRNLSNERCNQRDVCARAETKQGSKGNDTILRVAGDPKSKDPDSRKEADKDENVVTAHLIAKNS